MHRPRLLQTALLLFAPMAFSTARAQDWPQWRGPNGNNHAAPGAAAPTQWSETSGLAWKTPIPGRGHSSPTLFGDRIYLTTCDEDAETQSLLVIDRATGRLLKQTTAHVGKLLPKVHPNNTHASPTVACDGRQVYALFGNDLAAWVTAFDLEGNAVWQKRATGFDPRRYEFGFGSSPVLAGGLVVVTSEYDGPESAVVALNPADGSQAWLSPRTQSLSYSSVARVPVGGQTQLIMSGNRRIAAYDPASGRELWGVAGSTFATCGTMVWDEAQGLAFASGGYPDSFTLAVRTGGDHAIVWQNNVKCYEQSLLVAGDYLYGVSDRGVAYCWRSADGQEMWKERLGGAFSASPVLVDGKLYVTNESGTTFVYAATPDGYQPIAENQLGDEGFATFTPCDGRLYHRYAKREGGQRQEYLVAIGN
ncbi:MAG: PQQ-binding-like beta-propeller repeat protein [Planctomycetota bacterium]